MKKIKLLILIVTLSMAAQYCDSGAGDAAGLGGPEVTPEEIVEEATDLNVADAEDVLAAVQEELNKNAASYAGDTEALDEAEEQPGEDDAENLGEVVAEEEGDTVAEEAPAAPAVEETAAAEQPAQEAAPAETAQEETQVAEEQPQEEAAPAETAEQETQVAEEQPQEEAAPAETAEQETQVAEEEGDEQAEEAPAEVTAGMSVELDTTAGRWYKVEEKALDSDSVKKHKKNKDLIKDYRNKIKDLRAQLKDAEKAEKEAAKGKSKDKGKDKSKSDDIQAQIDKYLGLIKEARDQGGYGDKQKGIYTYWAKENLRLVVKNVSTPGWYTLRVVAKNYGKLPSWYKQFNISVINETEDSEVGGISIKASDKQYNRGALDVYLEEGDTDLNLLWTNDAYKKDSYNTAIQIKRVTLKWSKKYNKSMKRLVRNAHEYTTAEGRFFWDKNSAWTYWQDQTLGFSFPELEPGKYEITIMGKNYGELPLPADYEYFTVAVDADGTSAEAQVPAALKGWRKGTVVLDITGGTDIFLTWLNEKFKEGEYDTNFQFKKLKLKRVGDSDRSALAAYLLGTKSGNRVLMTGVLLALVGLIAMISIWNRGRARKQA